MKNKITLFLLLLSASVIWGQSHASTQAHQSAVTDVEILEGVAGEEANVISAGSDGFLIKWTSDGLGEHYQFTDQPIKMIARSPNGNDVAIYESDGASSNLLSVWNMKTFQRKCAFIFSDQITSLSYSSKGTYVICGTASVKGTYFLNTSNNSITSKKLKESSGAVSMVVTSPTENSAVMYSPTGSLLYYNIKTGDKKAKFYTEASLSQPQMFNNNVFFAGYKSGKIYVIQAVTGSTINSFPVNGNEPVIFSSNKNQNLYYIVNENRQFKLYMIQNDRNKNVIEPHLIRTFTGIAQGESIVCASLSDETVYAGTSEGNIYKFDNAVAERVDVLQAISEKMYDHIYDVSAVGDSFYFLTPNAIYLSSYDNGIVDKKAINPGQKNIITYGQNVILWSRDTKNSVQLIDIATGSVSSLFKPENNLRSLKLYNDSLIAIEGNSAIKRYSITDGTLEQLYLGAGIQDAVLYNEQDLFVAKTSATNPAVPFLYINTRTKETVPVNSVKGSVAYSLSVDSKMENSEIYGLLITTDATNKTKTCVFAYNPQTKLARTFLDEKSEDSDAFTYLSYPVLYTNVGKSRIRSYNLFAKRNFEYKRSASLPLKVSKNGNRLVVLNRDGSISWYNPDMNSVLADWYLTVDGQWIEY